MVGLLTFYWADDYGAMLQAYGLKRCLEELGRETEIIPYAPYRLEGRYRWFAPRYQNWAGEARLQVKECLKAWLRRPFPNGTFLRRRKAMASFRRRYLTARAPLRSAEELCLEGYDRVFVGSDQIWNPEITLGIDDAYIGKASARGGRLAAYGASLGGTELPEAYREAFSAQVGRAFDGISLREQSAVPGMEALLGRKVTDVLDPVFLLERREWEKLAVTPAEKGYVLVYQTEMNEFLMEYAHQVGRELGVPVVDVSFFRNAPPPAWAERRASIGPLEFAGYVRGAACVLTNSFHGAAFSILFEKPFLVFPLVRNAGKNPRLTDLLEKLGLEARKAAGTSVPEKGAVWEALRWSEVRERLEAERERSIRFIRKYL